MAASLEFIELAVGISYHASDLQNAQFWEEKIRKSMQLNDVDAVSLLLTMPFPHVKDDAERLANELLQLTMGHDSAECAMMLIDYLEELRRAKQQRAEECQAQEANLTAEASRVLKINQEATRKRQRIDALVQQNVLEAEAKAIAQSELQELYCQERERHCCVCHAARSATPCTRASAP